VSGIPQSGIASVDAVQAWIDSEIDSLPAEHVPLSDALGRIVAVDCRTDMPIPNHDRATVDGFAIHANESIGAAAYNPLSVSGVAVALGDALPRGSDAVVSLDAADFDETGGVLLIEAVARGANVEPAGAAAAAGAILVPAAAPLASQHIGVVAAAGIADVAVIKRPRVEVLIVERSAAGKMADGNGPMIAAAIGRDGGIVAERRTVSRDPQSLVNEVAAANVDLLLIVGGTGPGPNDHAADAVREVGELVSHGVAMRPGETFGLGRARNFIPVMLLPGGPASCLWSYEMFAGRAIRRLAGRRPDLPFPRRTMILARKVVSSIGLTEICPVRFGTEENTVEPLPSFAAIGLAAPVGADAFIIVPEGSEGYAQGASVMVRLYDGGHSETAAPS
jgi:molybdopterin molybdotransferase